jgi:hypothetical protein
MLLEMLRSASAIDEVKMYGATELAWISIGAADLAARIGVALQRDPDFMPGLGPFDVFFGETDDDVMFTFASNLGTFDGSYPKTTVLYAHSLADLPAIARALGLTMADLHAADAEPPKPWLVVRKDNNGGRFVLNRCETKRQAERAAEIWIRRISTHRQSILVEPG